MTKTEQIRVASDVRWALKIASARLDCSIIELLTRVQSGDKAALRAWWAAAKEIE
jgi:hypothetical protein